MPLCYMWWGSLCDGGLYPQAELCLWTWHTHFRVNKAKKKKICEQISEAQTNLWGKFPLRCTCCVSTGKQSSYSSIFAVEQTSVTVHQLHNWYLLPQSNGFTMGETSFSKSCGTSYSRCFYRVSKHLLFRAGLLQCISPTLMQQQLLQLQELFPSDWVRVPLTFSHFTETVLKRPSQSPDFMAEPSQGPTDLMDITRINQTFMPTHSSTVGDEAWLCVEEWHDLELRSVCEHPSVCHCVCVCKCAFYSVSHIFVWKYLSLCASTVCGCQLYAHECKLLGVKGC